MEDCLKELIRITPLNAEQNKDARSYFANPDHLERIEELLFYAKDEMHSPCVFYLLSHVSDPDSFNKADFLKNIKRAIKRQFKKRKQESPDILVVYSIEFKETTIDEINDTDKAYDNDKSKLTLPFLHIHVCIIADCRKTIPQSFNGKAKAALNEINGLSKARYFKSKARYISVLNEETGERERHRTERQMYKRLKTEFDDVYDRLKYFAKVEQKDSENIPFRQTFGSSRLQKK